MHEAQPTNKYSREVLNDVITLVAISVVGDGLDSILVSPPTRST